MIATLTAKLAVFFNQPTDYSNSSNMRILPAGL